MDPFEILLWRILAERYDASELQKIIVEKFNKGVYRVCVPGKPEKFVFDYFDETKLKSKLFEEGIATQSSQQQGLSNRTSTAKDADEEVLSFLTNKLYWFIKRHFFVASIWLVALLLPLIVSIWAYCDDLIKVHAQKAALEVVVDKLQAPDYGHFILNSAKTGSGTFRIRTTTVKRSKSN
jgi:hypothetical protein